jgi:hypothetical protein
MEMSSSPRSSSSSSPVALLLLVLLLVASSPAYSNSIQAGTCILRWLLYFPARARVLRFCCDYINYIYARGLDRPLAYYRGGSSSGGGSRPSADAARRPEITGSAEGRATGSGRSTADSPGRRCRAAAAAAKVREVQHVAAGSGSGQTCAR